MEAKLTLGQYVRENVIPDNLTVTDAAKLLGIGRPALSNFLNGRARLSRRMALRLESAFGVNSQLLLDMQSELESRTAHEGEQPVVTGTYAPALVSIRARQIEEWSDRIETRSRLAVLLRKLVGSSLASTTQMDFPGYDNAERRGWDGYVESGTPTPWIPVGCSGWEFGTGGNPTNKANSDFRARLRSVSPEDRAELTFVFVTPRPWSGKDKWVEEKRSLSLWKDVRAYDGSDLEQWIEQSVPAQVWFTEEIGLPVTGYRSLEECWRKWSVVTKPELTQALFEEPIKVDGNTFDGWIGKTTHKPMVIAADSTSEALAFLYCLSEDRNRPGDPWGSRTIVIDSPEALKRLDTAPAESIIAVSTSIEVERALAPMLRNVHCVFVRSRNLVDSTPDISLGPLSREAFSTALANMGIAKDDTERLGRESARSPTILRRRLSDLDVIKFPTWARDDDISKKLAPIALIGGWHRASFSDREVLKVMAEEDDYKSVESTVDNLLQLEDSPVWRVGEYQGVASKMDALFAAGRYISDQQIDTFFLLAEYVLSETDPALELSEDERWMASIYGKVREHSANLRKEICETLVILATHGNDISRRPYMGIERRVTELIEGLLNPFNAENLYSYKGDLPNFAEAAPRKFLNLLENDLRSECPAIFDLFLVEGSPMFGGSNHTGLLWALERLAWNPVNLMRVVDVLARLCSVGIARNVGNTPLGTLGSIFRSWLPQTAATLQERIQALKILIRSHPEAGWIVCMNQLQRRPDFALPNQRPRWRSDAAGAGYGVGQDELVHFKKESVSLALDWPCHDQNTLGDLVDRVGLLTESQRQTLFDLIERWSGGPVHQNAKAELWLRMHIVSRRAGTDDHRIRLLAEKLLPSDPVALNEWLFTRQSTVWLEADLKEELDYRQQREEVSKRRVQALRDIWNASGLRGVGRLIEKDEYSARTVGMVLPEVLGESDDLTDIVRYCIEESSEENVELYATCLREVLWQVRNRGIQLSLDDFEERLSREKLLLLYTCKPFRNETWRMLDSKHSDVRQDYWSQVNPYVLGNTAEEVNEIVDRLLEFDRPQEAMNAVEYSWELVETSRLRRLLNAYAASASRAADVELPSQHSISDAFESLDNRSEVTDQEKSQLEFLYAKPLEHSRHGIPNLERDLATYPEVFVELVALLLGKGNNTNDANREVLASSAFTEMNRIRRTPGTGDDGIIDVNKLKSWIDEVRDLSKDLDYADVCDSRMGELLSRAPVAEADVWPCRQVCEALESVRSESMGLGFKIGVSNDRGASGYVVTGGNEERELAEKYRVRARRLSFKFPFVATLVEDIAKSYEADAEFWETRAEIDQRFDR